MRNRWLIGIVAGAALASAGANAFAAAPMRASDPPDTAGADLSGASVTYDSAGGRVAITVAFYRPLAQGVDVSATLSRDCADTTPARVATVAFSPELGQGTLSTAGGQAPLQAVVEPDRKHVSVTATSPGLVGRDFRCARVEAFSGSRSATRYSAACDCWANAKFADALTVAVPELAPFVRLTPRFACAYDRRVLAGRVAAQRRLRAAGPAGRAALRAMTRKVDAARELVRRDCRR
ncbi:MAG TPA: hypothetical protein VFZ00_01485 [Solirubrobacter sp.]|nr:hypothetical protein [Solirubrobacter sp.]